MDSNEDALPLLFEKYPGLGRSIAYQGLKTVKTPVERLRGLGHDGLWIKRDDRISPAYGGNKVRKLEFILGDVLKKGARHVVTLGAIGTNHGLATAIFCRRLGIKCTLVLFDQQVTPYVRNNLRLFHHYGADIVYCPSMYHAGLHYYLIQRLKYPRAYFLEAGGSSPLGTLGIVNGAFELVRQVEAGEMPQPDYVFCATASNGTLAGLTLGFALAGLRTRVIGVRVGVDRAGPLQFNTPSEAARHMQSVLCLMRRCSNEVPSIRTDPPFMLDGYVGVGYGIPTKRSLEAVELFRKEVGIFLEPVYTGKTCAALLDFIRDPSRAGDTILFWDTFSSIDLSRESQAADYRLLPERLHRLFEENMH